MAEFEKKQHKAAMAELPFWKIPTVPQKCEIAQNNEISQQ